MLLLYLKPGKASESMPYFLGRLLTRLSKGSTAYLRIETRGRPPTGSMAPWAQDSDTESQETGPWLAGNDSERPANQL